MTPDDVPPRLGEWQLTWHARKRLAERGFDLGDVAAAAMDPDVRYPSPAYGPDVWTYRRGIVAVGVSPTTRTIITVLLGSSIPWTDADANDAAARAGRPAA